MSPAPLFDAALGLADDALIAAHRLSEWSSRAPTLEEDIALSNLGLDLIGQARAFYAVAGAVEGAGRDENAFAYFRDAHEFRNVLLVELPNGDFARTILRHLFLSAALHPLYREMSQSSEPRLAEIARKAFKEMTYHVSHAATWVIRLGDGTAQSRARCLSALDDLWGYTGELLTSSPAELRLVADGILPDRAALTAEWAATIERVLSEATLPLPRPRPQQSGGRLGRHTEHLDHLLTTMQVLARRHPDATW
jgi:ring-1,2-phenylacetyl-CoA epoxidase subunit PaaC